MAVAIVKADLELFRQHQERILEIEKDLILNSSLAYFFDREDELDFMLDAFRKGGYSYLAMADDEVIGFLVVGPLNDGSNLPEAIVENYSIDKCLYVKMMYVGKPGQGIGKELMQTLIDEMDRDQWEYLFVRTWIEPPNEGAIRFYTEKCGFEAVPEAIVESEKLTVDQKHTFNIKRQYFARNI